MLGLLRKVLRDLWQRPLRAALTVLGVAVGVAGLVAIISTGRNLERAQRALYVTTSQADLRVWVWEAPPSMVTVLEHDSRVAAAELRTSYVTRWRLDGAWGDVELLGIEDFDAVAVNRFELLAGRYPGRDEVLVDAAGLSNPPPLGAEIAVRDSRGRERLWRVSGYSRTPGYLSGTLTRTAVGYVPAAAARRLQDRLGGNQLLISLVDSADRGAVAQDVARVLAQREIPANPPEVLDPRSIPGRRELDALLVVMLLFSLLGLAVSAILVVNTLSASVAEQVGEIGVLKALGATRRQILGLYLVEALVYGIVGTLLGVGLGTVAGWRLLAWAGGLGNTDVGFRLAPEGVLLGALVGIGVTVGAALVPASGGTRITIKEALESHGIEASAGRSRLDDLLRRLRGAPPLALMALRNLGRRAARSGLALVVVALATAAFLSALATRDSVNAAIDGVYGTYRADAWVWFGETVAPQTVRTLAGIEGVEAAEGWLTEDGLLGRAEARLWGVPAGSRLYQQVMREGRWYAPGELDVAVVSAELADRYRIRPGNWAEVQVGGRLRRVRVVGIAVDNSIFLGSTLAGKVFLPYATLAHLLNAPAASLYALGLSEDTPQAAEAVRARIEFQLQAWRPTVQPVYAEIAAARQASLLLTLALAAMVVLVGLAGGLGMLNTLTLNVLDRRREIAVLRALGASNGALLLAFLVEGLALGGLGGLLGLLIGWPVGKVFASQLGRVLFVMPYVVHLRSLALGALFAVGLALVASLGPALGAAQFRLAESLRYE